MQVSRTLFLIFVFLSGNGSVLAFQADKIAVFYPEVQEPYRSIYQEIVAGSHQATQDSGNSIELVEFVLRKGFNSKEIANQLTQLKISKVIVLGRLGYKLAKVLTKDFSVVSGALPISPNGVSGISLISDPAYLFNYLEQVAPDVKKVHVAYSQRSSWLIELAKSAAKERGLELNLIEVTSTKEAIGFYQTLFESNISKADAIWLPLDRVSSHDKITLPMILEKAWARDIVVFSSKPSHAKRGALFSTYPDNFVLGKHLLEMVQTLAKSPQKKQFEALSSLQLAVNLRTAAHLGLKYSSAQQQQFKLTFPE